MPCPAVPVGGPVDPSGMGLDFPPVSPPVSTSASSSASSSPSASSPSSAASVTGKRSYVQRHSTSEVAAATLSGGSAAASPAGLAAASAAYSQPSSPSPSSSLSLSLDERMVRPMPGSVPSSPPGPVRPPSTLATNLTQSPPCVEQGHPPCRQLSCEEMAVSYDPDIAPGIPCRPLAELVFPGPEMDRVCKKIQPKIKAGIEVLPRVCGGTGVGAFSPPALPIDAGGGAAPPSDVGDVMEGIEGSKIGDGDGSMERRDGAGDGGVESIAVPSGESSYSVEGPRALEKLM